MHENTITQRASIICGSWFTRNQISLENKDVLEETTAINDAQSVSNFQKAMQVVPSRKGNDFNETNREVENNKGT